MNRILYSVVSCGSLFSDSAYKTEQIIFLFMIPEWFILIPWYKTYYANKEWKIYRYEWSFWSRKMEWHFLKPYISKLRFWYNYISLYEKWWIKRKNWILHKLIAITFIPNPENKPQVNHKDGNKNNNSVDNLEWVTDRENKIHARKNWLYNDKKSVIRISTDWEKIYESISLASKENNICTSDLSKCCNNKKKTAWWFIWKFL